MEKFGMASTTAAAPTHRCPEDYRSSAMPDHDVDADQLAILEVRSAIAMQRRLNLVEVTACAGDPDVGGRKPRRVSAAFDFCATSAF